MPGQRIWQMATCDNSDYRLVWFHYAFVVIKRDKREHGPAVNASELRAKYQNYLLSHVILSKFSLLL